MATEQEKRFDNYWKDPERIRERNRAYYWKKRGLPVPEKKIYKLRTEERRSEAQHKAYAELADERKKLQEMAEALKEREKKLKEKEKQIDDLLAHYTYKSYQPGYEKKLKEAKKEAPPPPPAPVISFTLGGGNFV